MANRIPRKSGSGVIEIRIGYSAWRRILHLGTRLEEAAEAVRAALPAKFRFPWTATVLLTDDRTIRRLNHDFRGLDKPTNVLSFPQFKPAELAKIGKKGGTIPVGDLALGYQYIVRETGKDNNMLINHLIHLVIHGVLHLFGYDHRTDAEADRMEWLEKTVMTGLGLPCPQGSGEGKNQKRTRPRPSAFMKRTR